MMIPLMVDADDELATIVAHANHVPAENFGGLWGTKERHSYSLSAPGAIVASSPSSTTLPAGCDPARQAGAGRAQP